MSKEVVKNVSGFIDNLPDGAEVSKKLREYLAKDDWIQPEEVGYVHTINDGIATIRGLYNAFLDEVIEFESGNKGIVKELKEYEVQVVLFDNYDKVKSGMKCARTNSVLKVPVGEGVIGRVVDPFGNSIDGMGEIKHVAEHPYNADPPSLIQRKMITRQLVTGLIAVDTTIPIGLGQRELILGDISTGKTSIAMGMIINQLSRFKNGEPIYCFYVSIGQKGDDLVALQKRLTQTGAMEYTTIVAAFASDSAHSQFIAPYSACTMAEYLMKQGKDVLIIYDDLSNHANAHRELCRLMRFPAGREAYPADIFALHAKLLERAACMSDECGGGSLTAIPIIKTEGGDYSKYIPTNVISITDGQILLQGELSYKQMPPINIGLSVSRVGAAAQCMAMREASKGIRVTLSRYKELSDFEVFAGSDVFDKSQKAILDEGKQLSLLMSQYIDELYSMEEQVILLIGAKSSNILNNSANPKETKREFLNSVEKNSKVKSLIQSKQALTADMIQTIKKIAEGFSK